MRQACLLRARCEGGGGLRQRRLAGGGAAHNLKHKHRVAVVGPSSDLASSRQAALGIGVQTGLKGGLLVTPRRILYHFSTAQGPLVVGCIAVWPPKQARLRRVWCKGCSVLCTFGLTQTRLAVLT